MSFYWSDIKQLTPQEIKQLSPGQQALYMDDPSMWLSEFKPDPGADLEALPIENRLAANRETQMSREKMANVAMLAGGIGAIADAYYSSAIQREQLAIKKSDQQLATKLATMAHKQDKIARQKKFQDMLEQLSAQVNYTKKKHREQRANLMVMQREGGMQGQSAVENVETLAGMQETYLHKMVSDQDRLEEEVMSAQYAADVNFASALRQINQSSFSPDVFGQILGKGLQDAADSYYTIKYDLGGTA